MNRRSMLARVAAAGPVAAVLPVLADGDNKYLTAVKRPDVQQVKGADNWEVTAVGRGAALDENGAAAKVGIGAPSTEIALGSSYEYVKRFLPIFVPLVHASSCLPLAH